MSASPETLAFYRNQVAGTPLEPVLDYTLAQSHEARVDAVQRSVDFACNHLIEHRDKQQGKNENALTVQICGMLSQNGYKAAHDEAIGGHCDIVVRGDYGFLWLAEAKVHDAYSWLDKGFQQLSTRYSTGIVGQDNGEVLVYCFVQNAKAMLERWKKELVSRNPSVGVNGMVRGDPLTFQSQHTHKSSGLDFYIRHKVVSLHWEPEDK